MLAQRGQYLANSLWAVGYRILRSRFERDRESTRLVGVRLPTLLFAVVPVLAPLRAVFIRPWRRREKPADWAQDDRRLWSALLTASLLVLLVCSF
jgi:hypothetical protein